MKGLPKDGNLLHWKIHDESELVRDISCFCMDIGEILTKKLKGS